MKRSCNRQEKGRVGLIPQTFRSGLSHRLSGPFRMVMVLLAALTGSAQAIQPSQWVHTTEADFAAGTTENTVVTNLGDVKLATQTDVIGEIPEQASVIYDLQATADGDLYLAVGPEAAVLRRRGEHIEEVLRLPASQVFSLDLTEEGALLVAISSSTNSRVAVLDGEELQTLVELEGVRYIWDMVVDGSHLYVGTGTDGKLLRIDLNDDHPPNEPKVIDLLDAAQSNLLCLAQDRHGRICVGTDTDGLVYRVTVADDGLSQVFVLYDAPEPEIGTLLAMDDGTLYAGTADAEQARPGRLDEATEEFGRPELTESKKPATPEDLPQVPPKPDPKNPAPNTPLEPLQDQPEDSSSTNDLFKEDLNALVNPQHRRPSNASVPLDARERRAQDETNLERSVRLDRPMKAQPLGGNADIDSSDSHDVLRELIRRRIEEAKRSGLGRPSSQNSGGVANRNSSLRNRRGKRSRAQTERESKEGNAIYRIDPEGFVTEVFRESVMILNLINDPSGTEQLLVATGNEGQIFRVDPASEETIILADLEPEQVPAIVADAEGRVLLGTANPATLVAMASGYAREGTYTSPVLDAQQISLWGKFNITGTTPDGTSVTVEARSGNVEDPDQAAWSNWSTPQVLAHDPNHQPTAPRQTELDCPPARFLQYRLNFAGQGLSTAVVDWVAMKYVVPNLKPVVTSITAEYAQESTRSIDHDETQHTSVLKIKWQASDPNSDRLRYTLEYQPAQSQRWLSIAQDLDDDDYEWDTRHVPDGRYFVRVTARDSPDNASDMIKSAIRRSEPILIDNSPPDLGPLGHRVEEGAIWIASEVRDKLSPIRSVQYSLDSQDWKPVLPDDLIYDSTRETFTIKIEPPENGPHIVTVRATDTGGNIRYEAVSVEVK